MAGLGARTLQSGESPVVAKFLRHWADRVGYAKVPARVMQRVAMSRAGGGVERRRRWVALDWYCRTGAAIWLKAAWLTAEASDLKALGPIRGEASASDAYMVLEGAEGPLEIAAEDFPQDWWWDDLAAELGDSRSGFEAVLKGVEAAVAEALEVSGMEAAWEAAAGAEPLDLAKTVISDAARAIAGGAVDALEPAELAEEVVAARLTEAGNAGRTVEAVLEEVVKEYARWALEDVVADLRRSSLVLLKRMIAAGDA